MPMAGLLFLFFRTRAHACCQLAHDCSMHAYVSKLANCEFSCSFMKYVVVCGKSGAM